MPHIFMCVSCSVLSDCLRPHGLQLTRLLCPWISQARILGWVAIPFSRGSYQPRDHIHVSFISCIGSLPLAPPGKPRIWSETHFHCNIQPASEEVGEETPSSHCAQPLDVTKASPKNPVMVNNHIVLDQTASIFFKETLSGTEVEQWYPKRQVYPGPMNATLFGKSVFANVCQLRILTCDHPKLSRGV